MRFLLVVFVGCFASGCGFAREAFKVNAYSAPVHEPTTAEKLDSQLGIMNFETALQWFGPPANCAEAGSTKTCIWSAGPDGVVSSIHGASYDDAYGGGYGGRVVTQAREGPKAQLAFKDDKLVNWRLTGRWR